MIKAILVEDSELARIELKNLLKKRKDISLLGEAINGKQAINLINKENPDVVFMDIHLPDMDGFDILNELNAIPQLIFTTAYDEYAIKSFEYNTLDYLLKPVKEDRLNKAIDKIIIQKNKAPILSSDNSIFIKDSDKCYIAKLQDVSLFETTGNYTKVFFNGKSPLLHKSLNTIENRLDKNVFFRINRQQMINVNHIIDTKIWFKSKLRLTLSCQKEVEVSERQSVALKKFLSI